VSQLYHGHHCGRRTKSLERETCLTG